MTVIQTCQGPEMKMRQTVRHSGEGAIISGGMRPLSKFSDSCLHSCCITEEIKFSIKPITRKPIENLWLFYKIKYKTLSVRRTYMYVYDISVANPAYTKWTQCHRPQISRCAAKNESTLAQSFTMDEFGAGTLSLCRVSDGAAHEY